MKFSLEVKLVLAVAQLDAADSFCHISLASKIMAKNYNPNI